MSWTAFAKRYGRLQTNAALPITKFSSHINANSSKYQKQLYKNLLDCNCWQNVGANSVLYRKNSVIFRKYSWLLRTNLAHGNTKTLSKYGIKRCQKSNVAFALVSHTSQFHTSSKQASTRLTPAEATNMLRKHEYTTEEDWLGPQTDNSPVKSFDMNSLRSNNPTEDAHSEAILRVGTAAPNGMLFGIFDGHGGAACGQVSQYFKIYRNRPIY